MARRKCVGMVKYEHKNACLLPFQGTFHNNINNINSGNMDVCLYGTMLASTIV